MLNQWDLFEKETKLFIEIVKSDFCSKYIETDKTKQCSTNEIWTIKNNGWLDAYSFING